MIKHSSETIETLRERSRRTWSVLFDCRGQRVNYEYYRAIKMKIQNIKEQIKINKT